jgi:endonuclease/exonuclease/phosphatase family metal-dependent hydrolase
MKMIRFLCGPAVEIFRYEHDNNPKNMGTKMKMVALLIIMLSVSYSVFAEDVSSDLSEKKMLEMFASQRARIALLEQKIDRFALQANTHEKKANEQLDQMRKMLEIDYKKKAAMDAELNSIRDNIATNYLSKADASQTYITKAAADSSFLLKSSASEIYLSKAVATSRYLSHAQVQDSVKETLRKCRVHLGWSDSGRNVPDQSISRSLLGERNDDNRIRMQGDVNGDDSLYLWTSCEP